MKKTKIEIEKRGALNKQQKEQLLDFLEKKAKFIGECNQLSVFCEAGSRYTGEIENTKASISISLSKDLLNKKTSYKLKVKTGKMESGTRKEIIFPFKSDSLGDVLDLLKVFEINIGCPRFYHRIDYKLGRYYFSIKERGYAPDHFEIETMVNSEEKIEKESQKIEKLLKSLGLKFFNDEEYKNIMLGTFKKYPPIPFEEVDFSIIDS